MALPTFVALGVHAGSLAAITPALPAGIQTDDILILAVSTNIGEAAGIDTANGGTYTEVGHAEGAVNAKRTTVFWSRYNGTQTAPVTTDSGNHQQGVFIAVRGCIASGDPVDVSSSGFEDTADTTISVPGATTTGTDRFVVIVVSTSEISAHSDAIANPANSDLANLTVRYEAGFAISLGSTMAILTGEKATAGAYGNTTMDTATGAEFKSYMTLALKPAAEAAAPDETMLLLGVS